MPTINQLGLGQGNTLGNLGAAAGTFPAPPIFTTIGRVMNAQQPSLGAYIGAYGPRSVTGPARGSPAGPPTQAQEASPFALTRERIRRELEDNPGLRAVLDANTTAEVGTDPEKRRWYQALTIDRAVQTGAPLAEVVNARNYYPPTTTGKTATTGMGVDPSIWEGANPANYATGNASYDPRTGRWVGFAGGPQTSTFGAGRGMELAGIEGKGGVPYAREMGYLGPATTPIGPAGPRGPGDTTPLAGGGWETSIGASPGGVGYVNPERVAQGATTDPRLLVRPDQGFSLGRFLANFDFTPARVQAPAPFSFGAPVFGFRPLGNQRRGY